MDTELKNDRRDTTKDFGKLINGLLEVYGEQCEERMKASSTLGRISATLLANFGPNGFCIKDLVSLEDDSEEMLLKVLNHLVGQKVRNRKRVAMRDYQGRIYEDDCICPDCIHCDPVADECLKGRWRYPTDGCFDFVSEDGKGSGLGERIKVVKND